MGVIFIFLAILIISAVIFMFDKFEHEGRCVCCMCLMILSSIILLFSIMSLININRKFQRFVIDYNNTTAFVESYNGGEYGNMPELTGKILDINEVIANHKAYCNNFWTGIWYSETIGNLEPITFKKE